MGQLFSSLMQYLVSQQGIQDSHGERLAEPWGYVLRMEHRVIPSLNSSLLSSLYAKPVLTYLGVVHLQVGLDNAGKDNNFVQAPPGRSCCNTAHCREQRRVCAVQKS